MNTTRSQQHDVLIIGSGAAGISMALTLADSARVALVAKEALTESATLYAQGGISAVLDKTDSLVNFTRDQNRANSADLHLTQEGGHSHRRVIHAADATGREMETTLAQQAHAHPNIEIFERHIAIDLITGSKLGWRDNHCHGAYILDRDNDEVIAFSARAVVLATGGAGKVYLYTSNPDVASGDGIAMAWRAGCRIANMEFIQFHPTCLFHPEAKSFLVTEALRGEGAKLRLPDGSSFMEQFDERAELAPRDIVARAIDYTMKRSGVEYVHLDISHKPEAFIKEHFPTIYARCLQYGYDITQQPIPVVPAAHYICGGIMSDINGRSDIEGLYAVGEAAYTGMHGANRMASNSLLECLAFAESASRHILEMLKQPGTAQPLPEWDESRVTDSDEEVVVTHNWHELRRFMWDYVGIVRTDKRLQRAKNRVDLLQHEISDYYSNFRVTSDLIELRNLTLVADLIIRSAILRKESRGLHFTLDYPDTSKDKTPQKTILIPNNYLKGKVT